jgi:hypothetical protein
MEKKICFIGNSHINQFNLPENIDRLYCLGASIKGLSNPNSTLKLHEKIQEYCDEKPDAILLFVLGQVDIEFGYYYKCVKDGVKYAVKEYCDDLTQGFEQYLCHNIKNPFYVLSINPTVITDIIHNFNVSFRCINGIVGFYSELNESVQFEDVSQFYNDSFEVRFENNRIMNDSLRAMCEKNGFKFIDFWDVLLDEENRVKQQYLPYFLDHHLCVGGTEILERVLREIYL